MSTSVDLLAAAALKDDTATGAAPTTGAASSPGPCPGPGPGPAIDGGPGAFSLRVVGSTRAHLALTAIEVVGGNGAELVGPRFRRLGYVRLDDAVGSSAARGALSSSVSIWVRYGDQLQASTDALTAPICELVLTRGFAQAHAATRNGFLVLDSVSLVEGEPVHLAYRRASVAGAGVGSAGVGSAGVGSAGNNARGEGGAPARSHTYTYVAGLRMVVPDPKVLANPSDLEAGLRTQRDAVAAAALAEGAGLNGGEVGKEGEEAQAVRCVPRAVVLAGIEGGVTGGVSVSKGAPTLVHVNAVTDNPTDQ